jgi:4-amino-4-deoxy-L-arabinose transferase-like glycosyltransferase
MNRAVTRKDHLLGAALGALYAVVLLGTASDLGLSRDEGIYVVAAESYGRWLELLVAEPAAAFEQASIDRHFAFNHEHPALVKLLAAIGHSLDQKLSLFTRDSHAFRLPGMLSAGLLVWLIYVFGTRLCCRRVGLVAALAYALLPRPFYHAHLLAFDVPITLATTAVAYAYLRSWVSPARGPEPRFAPALRACRLGLLFGLALATKHNSWLLPGIFAIHSAWVALFERARRKATGRVAISLTPRGLAAMLVLGPIVFLASWPWLWHDTLARLRDYAAFHLHHEYYNIEYFGVNYFWPPFPVSYPWVMTLFTVPVSTLALGCVGLGLAVTALWARARRALAGGFDEHEDPLHTHVLLLGCLLAPLVVISLPSTPIFGGTKHWFPSYPFLALFCGLGFERLLAFVRARITRSTRWVAWPLGALALSPALVETAHSHPFALSHYGMAAGFVPGAADHGMNRQFWGFTTRSLADYLYERLPRGGRVYVCDTIDSAFRMLVRDGHLPENIHSTRDLAQADLALVHHELHFLDVEVQIWTTYGTTKPVHVLAYDGVPILSVYQNPKAR